MYNQSAPLTPQNFLKVIIIIHLALFMGQALFAAVVLFITKSPVLDVKPGSDPLFYIAPALVVFGIFTGSFLFKHQVAKLAEKPSLKEKLGAYQVALIIRYALGEGSSLFGIVCMLLTHNIYYLIVVGVNIIYFIMIRPSKFKIQEDLSLGYAEQAEMDIK